jgi:phosphoribosyl-AMP cyclohydrolase
MSAVSDAYGLGFDCGRHGPNTTNCHFSIFASRELTDAWERGHAAGNTQRERIIRETREERPAANERGS